MKNIAQAIGFQPKENANDIYIKKYKDGYILEINFHKEIINYGDKIICESKTTQNFSQSENFVVLECVDRLLEKGYKPENIILEKTWAAGHGTSGRLDICVTREDGSEYLLIECKTQGKEFEKEFTRMKKDGGQLFTYFKFSNKADVIMLYSSELKGKEIVYRNEIVKIEEDYRTGDVKDFYDKWSKLTKDNGVFDSWVKPYNYESKALTIKELEEIQPEDSSFIFNRFLEILRHNVVSDKPNAFNKIFTLFLCKIYDEKSKDGTDEELDFQWIEGKDDDISFQLRLTDLYKKGMEDFLDKKVTDFSDDDFDSKYASLFAGDENLKALLKTDIAKLRLEKNNEFAIKEVYDQKSFLENAKVVKEVVELLQGFKIRYTQKQQYLSDFFELLLTTGLKQESGQFFTPVPIAQFVIKSLPIDKIVEEKLVAGKKDDLLPFIMDYAAGSGHFLTESMHEVQRLLLKIDTKKLKAEAKSFIDVSKIRHFDWALQYVYGIEKDYRLVKVGKVGCYLHGDGLANVIHSDGLSNFKHKDYKGKLRETDKDFPQENKQFEILISNPPYSISAFKNASREYYRENDFELYEKLTDNSSEIECLFIERTKQLLKDGGLAGIILPSSILSNTGIYSKSRELILQFFDIVGIAELGSNTFMATGTNTVTLFLKRRNNYESINLKIAVEKFFTDFQDVTLNGIEKPIFKYVNHVWENISFEDYISLLKKEPNKTITEHEIYKEYQKKLKAKNDKEFWNLLLEKETDKLYYFIIAYPQKVVLVKSGEKDAEKRFLGYEFSNRRGSEGIHPIQRGKNIEDCTQLFDAEIFDNPTKASTYIYKAFAGDYDFAIDKAMQNNVSRHNLVDMLTFDRVEFEKNISLSVKKKVKIESKWEIFKLSELVSIVRGASPRPIKEFSTTDIGGVNWVKIGDVKPDTKYITETKEKITIEGANKSRFVKKGDFILSNSMSFGRPYIMNIEGCIHDGWLLLSDFSENLNKDYLYYMLSDNLIQEQFISSASGGTSVDNLNIDKVAYTQIPLPPLDIQQKIVSEIEFLETKEKKAKEEVEKRKNDKNIIINDLFSKNKYVEISEIAKVLGGKRIPKGYSFSPNKTEYPYIRVSDFKNGTVNTNSLKYIEEEVFQQIKNYIITKEDIYISIAGTIGLVGLIPEVFDGKSLTENAAKIVISEKHKISKEFIYYCLISENLQKQIEDNTRAVGVPKLALKRIETLKIPLPAFSEQQKIVSEIEKIEAKIKTLETQIAEIPKQKEAILKKYL